MKRFLVLIFSIFAFFPGLTLAQTGERIDLFKADYHLRNDGLIEVTETINYDFGTDSRHGIYRHIPYKYNIDGKTVYINISQVKVNSHFEKYTEDGNVVLKIGDKYKTLTGSHTYEIKYLVKGGLHYFNDKDEFYWNVNGFGWEVPTARTLVRFRYDNEIEPQVSCYAGFYQSTNPCGAKELHNNSVLFAQNNLQAGQNLTVAVGFPRGTYPVVSAGLWGSGMNSITLWAVFVFMSILPLATFFIMLRRYWKWGRDPKGRGVIVVEYKPATNLRPVEMGAVLDFVISNRDISAEIVALASEGFLTITRIPKKFGSDDYALKRLGTKKPVVAFDQILLEGLFEGKTEIKLSEISNFTETATKFKEEVQKSLVNKGMFKESVGATIGKYVASGVGIGAIGALLWIAIAKMGYNMPGFLTGLPFVISGSIVAIFGFFMPARTALGVEAKEKALGFKRYLSAVEADLIKFVNAPKKDPKKFEEYLPFAMMFGAEKEWAKQFEGIYKGNPGWYNDPSGNVFVPAAFASQMSSFTSVASSSFTPASSSGSSGGGFSGGGFGGGGGGSW